MQGQNNKPNLLGVSIGSTYSEGKIRAVRVGNWGLLDEIRVSSPSLWPLERNLVLGRGSRRIHSSPLWIFGGLRCDLSTMAAPTSPQNSSTGVWMVRACLMALRLAWFFIGFLLFYFRRG